MLYLSVLILLLLTSLVFELNRGRYVVKANGLYNFYLIIFVLIAGLRWKVGGDSMTYQRFFDDNIPVIFQINHYSFTEFKYEPLFVILMSFCKTIVNEFWFFQFVHAIFINVVIFKFIKKHTVYKFTALFLYAFFYFFYFNTEILRESLAVCGFLLIYPFYQKNKWKKYYLYGLVLVLFHYSAIIIFLFPFFKRIQLTTKGLVYLGLIMILFIILNNFGSRVILEISFSNSLGDRYENYSSISYSLNGMIYIFIFFLLLPYIVYRFNEKNGIIKEFDDLIFVYFFLASIFVAVTGFGRFINYLGPFMVVYLANTLFNVVQSNKYKQVNWMIILILLIVPMIYKSNYYLRSTEKYVQNTKAYNLWYPYSSIFTKDEYFFREIIYQESMREASQKTTERK